MGSAAVGDAAASCPMSAFARRSATGYVRTAVSAAPSAGTGVPLRQRAASLVRSVPPGLLGAIGSGRRRGSARRLAGCSSWVRSRTVCPLAVSAVMHAATLLERSTELFQYMLSLSHSWRCAVCGRAFGRRARLLRARRRAAARSASSTAGSIRMIRRTGRALMHARWRQAKHDPAGRGGRDLGERSAACGQFAGLRLSRALQSRFRCGRLLSDRRWRIRCACRC